MVRLSSSIQSQEVPPIPVEHREGIWRVGKGMEVEVVLKQQSWQKLLAIFKKKLARNRELQAGLGWEGP